MTPQCPRAIHSLRRAHTHTHRKAKSTPRQSEHAPALTILSYHTQSLRNSHASLPRNTKHSHTSTRMLEGTHSTHTRRLTTALTVRRRRQNGTTINSGIVCNTDHLHTHPVITHSRPGARKAIIFHSRFARRISKQVTRAHTRAQKPTHTHPHPLEIEVPTVE